MALTEPLLQGGDEDKDKDAAAETQDSTVENGDATADPTTAATANGEPEESSSDDSVLGGLIVWSPIGLLVDPKQRKYPSFQWGYEAPVCGNPLPAGLGPSTPAIEQAWKDLVQALDDPIAEHQRKRCWFLTGVLVFLLILLPLLAPLVHSHPAKSLFLFPLLNLSAICCCHIVLKCWVDTPLQLALKTVVIDHNPVLKDQARVRMRIQKKRYPIFNCPLPTNNPMLYKVCCACFYVQDTVLVFEAYVPPAEREAQIAFV